MIVSHLLEWLLDLEAIRLGDEASLSVQWLSGWPTWVTLLAVAAALGWVWAIYRREEARRWGRVLGGMLRAALLGLMLAVLMQPVLLLRRNRVEPSQVVLMIDDSASMATSDRYPPSRETDALIRAVGLGGSGSAAPSDSPQTRPAPGPSTRADASMQLAGRSRTELLRAALAAGQWARLRALAQRNRLAVHAFAERARPQTAPADADALDAARAWLTGYQPTGRQTDVAGSLQQVLSEARSGRLAAVVVASDGRSTVSSDVDEAVKAAAELGVPVHAVMIGSPERRRDVMVGPALAEPSAFVRDLIAVEVRVRATGFERPVPLDVQLLGADDAVLARQRVVLGPDKDTATVELRHRPKRAGRLRMRARVDPLDNETNPNNNVAQTEVQVVDERVKVLYVDGYPRYEYRYLKNMLVREETIAVSCLLLSADEAFAQEGDEPVKRFPVTMAELEPFDVVIIGDADPRGDWLSPAQMEVLVRWVGDRGGSLLTIAGPRWMPHAYLGTPLEKLIPVRVDPGVGTDAAAELTAAFHPQLTVEGWRSSVFRFEPDPNANERTVTSLPGMFWFARTQGPRPGVEVLAEHPTARTVDAAMPLLVLGRYGAGATGFAGIEETWRWRREVGSELFDVYWLQLIRVLTRGQLLGRDRRFVLRTDRPRHDLGEPVVLSLTVRDEADAASLPDRLSTEIADANDRVVAHVGLTRLGKGAATYEGVFTPPGPGGFVARLDASLLRAGQRPPVAMIHVDAAGAELEELTPDHEVLRQLARRTGGLAVGLDGIGQIAERIEDRSVEVPDDVSEPLWDSKLVLVMFVLIIGVEWILRKALGLV